MVRKSSLKNKAITMRRKILLWLSAAFLILPVRAQEYILNHMDLGLNVGSTGIGVDVSMPVGGYVRMRTGFTYMPRFELKSNFKVEMNNSVSADKQRRMKDLMKNLREE